MRAFGRPDEAALVDALRGTPGAISLVATVDDRVVGHILFTPVGACKSRARGTAAPVFAGLFVFEALLTPSGQVSSPRSKNQPDDVRMIHGPR